MPKPQVFFGSNVCLRILVNLVEFIDQGVDENETKIPFADHVFLENYLKQFPDITAVQEFMTLVLNGLSKNSHLSIEEKRGIISWYRNYFTEKQPLIEEALNAERLEQEYHAKLEMQKSQMSLSLTVPPLII